MCQPEIGAARPLVAHAVLTEHHVARKRKAVCGQGSPPPLDDELPGAA